MTLSERSPDFLRAIDEAHAERAWSKFEAALNRYFDAEDAALLAAAKMRLSQSGEQG